MIHKTDGTLNSLRKAAAEMKKDGEDGEREGGVPLVTSRRGLAAWITVTRYPV